jgi:serine/threonine protein kinase
VYIRFVNFLLPLVNFIVSHSFMCKVTRNAHSGLLNARQQAQPRPKGDGQSQAHTQLLHSQVQQHTQKKNEQHAHSEQLVDDMIVEKVEKNSEDELSSACSSTAVARRHTPAASNSANAAVDSTNSSLRAISALCLPEKPKVVPGALIRECLLGQVSLGSYALCNNEFLPVVVKEFHLAQVLSKTTKNGHSLHEDALAELQIHAYIQKKQVRNVIGLYAMHLSLPTDKLFAYLEYAAKGELFSMLQSRGTPLPLVVSCNFLVQLLQGIAALHALNVVHRDLSLENLLLTQDNEVKICDFGLATICAPGMTIKDGRAVGKVKYMCPEVYYREEYDPRLADVWSSAVIFFLMLTNIFPYERPSADDPRLVMLCHGQINELLAHWQRPALDGELLELLSHMFCPPQERWTAVQLLQLPVCQRFANVSKADIAKALDPQANMAAGHRAATSVEESVLSVDSFADPHSMDSSASSQLETPSTPATPLLSPAVSEWSDHSHCQSEMLSNRPSYTLSVSSHGSVSSTAHCQSNTLPLAQPRVDQQTQMQMLFHTPAVAVEGRK